MSPSVVAGLGIKVGWTEEELGKAAELAARPAKVFADRDAAADRALKVAGLPGLQPHVEDPAAVLPLVERLALLSN